MKLLPFMGPSKKQQAEDLARKIAEFEANGGHVTRCAPKKAQGAEMSKRAAKSAAAAGREFHKKAQ